MVVYRKMVSIVDTYPQRYIRTHDLTYFLCVPYFDMALAWPLKFC